MSYLSNKTNAFLNRVKVKEMLKPDPEEDEEVIFILENRKHQEFSLGLKTILTCLYFADEQETMPKLPAEWWEKVKAQYQINNEEL